MIVTDMIVYHATLMIAAFLLMVSGAAIAKFFRKRMWWLTMHKRMGLIGSLLVLFGLITAFSMVWQLGGQHFDVPHTYLGVISALFAFSTPTLGLLQFTITKKAGTIRTIHRWSGRTTLLIMAATILSGLFHVGLLSLIFHG